MLNIDSGKNEVFPINNYTFSRINQVYGKTEEALHYINTEDKITFRANVE